MTGARRNDFDVTNTVQVSSPHAVRAAVETLFRPTWPGVTLRRSRERSIISSRCSPADVPGYFGVDTVYHDRQHTLDITLAMARLIVGYERQQARRTSASAPSAPWSASCSRCSTTSATCAATDDAKLAQRRRIHAHPRLARRALPRGLPAEDRAWRSGAESPREIVHFTGYERAVRRRSSVTDPRDIKLGHLLGTADMIAQMADRCYLEKCRDRLYAEFVLGGVALPIDGNGGTRQVKYASGLDLLRQTPEFVAEMRAKRLDGEFDRAYRYLEMLFDGRNPVHRGHRPQPRLPASRSCAARAGACCAAIRRSSPRSPTP